MNSYTLLGAQLVSFRNVWNSNTYRHILPMFILNKRDVTVKNIQCHFIQRKWRQILISWSSGYNVLQLLYLHHHTSKLQNLLWMYCFIGQRTLVRIEEKCYNDIELPRWGRLAVSVIPAIMVKNPNREERRYSEISTYEEFSIILGFATLVVLILTYKKK